MKPTQNKDLNQYLKSLTGAGMRILNTGRHIKLAGPESDWPFVLVPKSPSDMRSISNLKSRVRRLLKEQQPCMVGV